MVEKISYFPEEISIQARLARLLARIKAAFQSSRSIAAQPEQFNQTPRQASRAKTLETYVEALRQHPTQPIDLKSLSDSSFGLTGSQPEPSTHQSEPEVDPVKRRVAVIKQFINQVVAKGILSEEDWPAFKQQVEKMINPPQRQTIKSKPANQAIFLPPLPPTSQAEIRQYLAEIEQKMFASEQIASR